MGNGYTRFRAAKTVARRYEEGAVGLPKAAMVLTNSERRTAWCPRRWWYAYPNRLSTKQTAAMRFGSLYHEVLEGIYGWWRDDDTAFKASFLDECPYCNASGIQTNTTKDACGPCGGTGMGILQRIEIKMFKDIGIYDDPAPLNDESDRLRAAAEGYLAYYGEGPPKKYRVVALEAAIAAPVISPKTAGIFKSRVPVIGNEFGWELASTATHPTNVKNVLLPWFQLCTLDAVLQDRKTGDLWVGEFKTSADPVGYGRDLHLDTQIPGYMRALQWVVRTKKPWGLTGNEDVVGYIWDVTSSQPQRDPKRLKSGKVSSDSRQRVPSWRIKPWADDQTEPLTHEDHAVLKEMHNRAVQHVDPKLFHREWGQWDNDLMERYDLELYADTAKFANMWKAAINAMNESDVALAFPRVPLCRSRGGFCDFTTICSQGIAEDRSIYEKREPTIWLSKQGIIELKKQESEACPF